jgi:hypothetical protein
MQVALEPAAFGVAGLDDAARDAAAFFGDRDAGGGLSLPLRERGTHLGRFGLLGSLAHREAGEPGDREQQWSEDQVARGVSRVVVGHDRRSAEHDHQPEPRLNGVAEVPQQECGGKPGQGNAGCERDQLPIGEGQRRSHQPDGRRCGEREAAPPEQRKHDDRDRRDGEPPRRARLALRVVRERNLERARDRGDHDQRVEPVRAHEGPNPAHDVNVLHGSERVALAPRKRRRCGLPGQAAAANSAWVVAAGTSRA